MGHALGNVLPLAVAIAIFPIPIVASVLLVGSDRGRVKGLAFVGGWLAGLAVVGGLALLLGRARGESEDDASSSWTGVVLFLLGVVLLVLAAKQWRGRPRADEEAPVPSWMQTMDELGIAKVVGVGFALSGLNPKNMLLTVAAAAEIAYFELSADQQLLALAAFVLIASAGVLAPLVLSLALGPRAQELLEGLRRWLVRNNATIMAVIFVLIGAKLIGDAISSLSD